MTATAGVVGENRVRPWDRFWTVPGFIERGCLLLDVLICLVNPISLLTKGCFSYLSSPCFGKLES